jgi:hypothetical protein
VGEHYFRAVEARLVRGRAFSTADHESAPGAVVVNETAATLLWGDAKASILKGIHWAARAAPTKTITGGSGQFSRSAGQQGRSPIMKKIVKSVALTFALALSVGVPFGGSREASAGPRECYPLCVTAPCSQQSDCPDGRCDFACPGAGCCVYD